MPPVAELNLVAERSAGPSLEQLAARQVRHIRGQLNRFQVTVNVGFAAVVALTAFLGAVERVRAQDGDNDLCSNPAVSCQVSGDGQVLRVNTVPKDAEVDLDGVVGDLGGTDTVDIVNDLLWSPNNHFNGTDISGMTKDGFQDEFPVDEGIVTIGGEQFKLHVVTQAFVKNAKLPSQLSEFPDSTETVSEGFPNLVETPSRVNSEEVVVYQAPSEADITVDVEKLGNILLGGGFITSLLTANWLSKKLYGKWLPTSMRDGGVKTLSFLEDIFKNLPKLKQ